MGDGQITSYSFDKLHDVEIEEDVDDDIDITSILLENTYTENRIYQLLCNSSNDIDIALSYYNDFIIYFYKLSIKQDPNTFNRLDMLLDKIQCDPTVIELILTFYNSVNNLDYINQEYNQHLILDFYILYRLLDYDVNVLQTFRDLVKEFVEGDNRGYLVDRLCQCLNIVNSRDMIYGSTTTLKKLVRIFYQDSSDGMSDEDREMLSGIGLEVVCNGYFDSTAYQYLLEQCWDAIRYTSTSRFSLMDLLIEMSKESNYLRRRVLVPLIPAKVFAGAVSRYIEVQDSVGRDKTYEFLFHFMYMYRGHYLKDYIESIHSNSYDMSLIIITKTLAFKVHIISPVHSNISVYYFKLLNQLSTFNLNYCTPFYQVLLKWLLIDSHSIVPLHKITVNLPDGISINLRELLYHRLLKFVTKIGNRNVININSLLSATIMDIRIQPFYLHFITLFQIQVNQRREYSESPDTSGMDSICDGLLNVYINHLTNIVEMTKSLEEFKRSNKEILTFLISNHLVPIYHYLINYYTDQYITTPDDKVIQEQNRSQSVKLLFTLHNLLAVFNVVKTTNDTQPSDYQMDCFRLSIRTGITLFRDFIENLFKKNTMVVSSLQCILYLLRNIEWDCAMKDEKNELLELLLMYQSFCAYGQRLLPTCNRGTIYKTLLDPTMSEPSLINLQVVDMTSLYNAMETCIMSACLMVISIDSLKSLKKSQWYQYLIGYVKKYTSSSNSSTSSKKTVHSLLELCMSRLCISKSLVYYNRIFQWFEIRNQHMIETIFSRIEKKANTDTIESLYDYIGSAEDVPASHWLLHTFNLLNLKFQPQVNVYIYNYLVSITNEITVDTIDTFIELLKFLVNWDNFNSKTLEKHLFKVVNQFINDAFHPFSSKTRKDCIVESLESLLINPIDNLDIVSELLQLYHQLYSKVTKTVTVQSKYMQKFEVFYSSISNGTSVKKSKKIVTLKQKRRLLTKKITQHYQPNTKKNSKSTAIAPIVRSSNPFIDAMLEEGGFRNATPSEVKDLESIIDYTEGVDYYTTNINLMDYDASKDEMDIDTSPTNNNNNSSDLFLPGDQIEKLAVVVRDVLVDKGSILTRVELLQNICKKFSPKFPDQDRELFITQTRTIYASIVSMLVKEGYLYENENGISLVYDNDQELEFK
ncbi:hypothetical protein DLAC_08618 [Tieghemostelium lacteum]|uniref:Uncharacterized protein n=1 Tax=Tieghemostelium lacteum TaxID=361077 RepID=A0A151Z8B4_TIELA|nr:hypothetical protein DLAC_08618 [Tieghemostelium lacteum]|eukprot:KYQ90034.1 hypothetical protein DLAC_08618 [Tieghemostelium lacteum]